MPSDLLTGDLTFSVIVPLYNEEENVTPLIETVLSRAGADQAFLELVLIDDGSRDRTVELVLKHAASEPRIRLLRHGCNRGLGAAIRTGLEEARGDLILYTDADLPFDFSLIPRLIALGGPNQVVAGYRLNRDEGARRWILTKVYNSLIYFLFGLRVRDVNFACKIIPRGLARQIRLQSEGSFIDAELLLEAQRRGFAIREFPLVYTPRTRGISTLSRPQVIGGIIREMVNYLRRTTGPGAESLPLPPSPLVRGGVACVAAVLSLMPASQLGAALICAPFASVIAVSLYCGWKAGLLTALLSLLAIDFFLIPPVLSLSIGWGDLQRGALLGSAVLLVGAFRVWRKKTSAKAKPWSGD